MRRCLFVVLIGLAACNFDTGECYLRGDGTDGTDGVIITPTGVGGYGSVPPEPQSMDEPPPPVCNIASQTPCEENCNSAYESDAIRCGRMENESQRTACNDSAHARYTSCREDCERAGHSSCDEKYQDCVNNGPWRSCARPGSGDAGETRCRTCYRRCVSGDPPSAECRKCKF